MAAIPQVAILHYQDAVVYGGCESCVMDPHWMHGFFHAASKVGSLIDKHFKKDFTALTPVSISTELVRAIISLKTDLRGRVTVHKHHSNSGGVAMWRRPYD